MARREIHVTKLILCSKLSSVDAIIFVLNCILGLSKNSTLAPFLYIHSVTHIYRHIYIHVYLGVCVCVYTYKGYVAVKSFFYILLYYVKYFHSEFNSCPNKITCLILILMLFFFHSLHLQIKCAILKIFYIHTIKMEPPFHLLPT